RTAPRACIASSELSQRAQGFCAMRTKWWAVFAFVLLSGSGFSQQAADPEQLLQQADRLAWLKNWTRAEPLYGEAQQFLLRAVIVETRCTPRSTRFAGSFPVCLCRKSLSVSPITSTILSFSPTHAFVCVLSSSRAKRIPIS